MKTHSATKRPVSVENEVSSYAAQLRQTGPNRPRFSGNLRIRVLQYPVLLQFSVKRASVNSKYSGSLDLVTITPLQDSKNMPPFNFRQGQIPESIEHSFCVQDAVTVPDLWRQGLDLHYFVHTDCQRILDCVLQLSNITGPPVR